MEWTSIIRPKRSFLRLDLKSVWSYRDLLLLFVKRDFISVYKQTILGPVWFFLQPLFMTIVFTVVFGNIAGIQTDGVPGTLFYLSGLLFWNYFAESLNKTSNTFVENQDVFGKVYFPRLISPLSVIISNLLKFIIQLALFVGFYLYYYISDDSNIHLTWQILLFPYLVLLTGFLSLSFGLIITSLTTKYRDLRFLIQFGVQLWMYATPIIYPLSELDGKMRTLALLNPMTSIVETFKYSVFGVGEFSWIHLLYTTAFTFILFILGVLIFNKTEQNFMDTV